MTTMRLRAAAAAACLSLGAAPASAAWEHYDEEAAIKAANPYHQAIIEEQCRRTASIICPGTFRTPMSDRIPERVHCRGALTLVSADSSVAPCIRGE